jgi:hypothetical protein
VQREPKAYELHVGRGIVAGTFAAALMILASCQHTATEARARLADEKIANQICEVWTPITDTTSPQVRGINRARYAFCEGATKEKTK